MSNLFRFDPPPPERPGGGPDVMGVVFIVSAIMLSIYGCAAVVVFG